jgi:hypothetical protein
MFRKGPTTLDSGLGLPRSVAHIPEASLPDLLAAEAIEFVDATEIPFHFGPARGVLTAMIIGAGAWSLIFAAVALTRAIFFG